MDNIIKERCFEVALQTLPESLRKDIGEFNVFYINHDNDSKFDCQSYSRKGLYKISLLKGKTRLFYADKTMEFEDYALLFSNPNIPYSWEFIGNNHSSFFCVFTEDFIGQFNMIKTYPVFQAQHSPLYKLSKEQYDELILIFERMQREIITDFSYKYDVLRTIVLEIIHTALKMKPAESNTNKKENRSLRIASLFTELLERQFPIESTIQQIELRHPIDFANNLSIHVNHLNHSLKKITGKTTSHLIAERVLQEARILLKHTDWNIAEISWCLGFEELSNFINFFKKTEKLSPKSYRNIRTE